MTEEIGSINAHPGPAELDDLNTFKRALVQFTIS
jgi:hypothetical protein